MQDRFRDIWQGLIGRWNALEQAQKVRLSAIVVALLITLAATIYITTRPEWVVLVNKLNSSETGQIQNELKEQNIDSKFVDNATGIAVKKEFKDDALIVLSNSTALSSMDFTFQDALDASGMGSTESVKQASFKRLFESDLNKKLASYDWVESANATINLADDAGYWIKDSIKPTAGIVLNVKSNPDDVQANNVARMVARSVKGLSMDDIEITDQYANSIYSGLQKRMGTSGSEYEVRLQLKNELDAQVRKVLGPLYNEVSTISNIVVNWDKLKETSVNYSPPIAESTEGVIESRINEQSTVENGTVAEEPGAEANDQTTPSYDTGGESGGNASNKSTNERYLYNKVEKMIEASVGEVVLPNSSLTAYVYTHKHYYQEAEEPKFTEGQTWEEFQDRISSTKTPLVIPPEIVTSLQNGTGIQALTVVGFEVPVFHDFVKEPVKVEQYIIFAILALLILLLAYGLIKKTQKDEVIQLEPELSVEDIIISTKLEEEKEAETKEVAEIQDVQDETQVQLEKFIEDRPEAVALLLRNWLNDEWE